MKKTIFNMLFISLATVIPLSNSNSGILPSGLRLGIGTNFLMSNAHMGGSIVKNLMTDDNQGIAGRISSNYPIDIDLFVGYKALGILAIDGGIGIQTPAGVKLEWYETGDESNKIFVETKFMNMFFHVKPRIFLGGFYFQLGLLSRLNLSAKSRLEAEASGYIQSEANKFLDKVDPNREEGKESDIDISKLDIDCIPGLGYEFGFGLDIGINFTLGTTLVSMLKVRSALESDSTLTDDQKTKAFYKACLGFSQPSLVSIDLRYNFAKLINIFT